MKLPLETIEEVIEHFRQVGYEIEELANQNVAESADKLLEGAGKVFDYADRLESQYVREA